LLDGFPAKGAEPLATTPTFDRSGNVWNRVVRQSIQWNPVQPVAFPRFEVSDLAGPVRRHEEEVDVLAIRRAPVHHATDAGGGPVEVDSGLFTRLAAHRIDYPFAAVEVPGDHAVVAVFVAGVEASEQEDVIVPDQKEVDGEGCGESLCTGGHCLSALL